MGFYYECDMKRHLLKCGRKINHTCEQCNGCFPTNTALQGHIERYHLVESSDNVSIQKRLEATKTGNCRQFEKRKRKTIFHECWHL